MEIWEPKPPGTLRAKPVLLRDAFTFVTIIISPIKKEYSDQNPRNFRQSIHMADIIRISCLRPLLQFVATFPALC